MPSAAIAINNQEAYGKGGRGVQSFREYVKHNVRDGGFAALVALYIFVVGLTIYYSKYAVGQYVLFLILVIALFILLHLAEWFSQLWGSSPIKNWIILAVPIAIAFALMWMFGRNSFILWMLILPVISIALALRLRLAEMIFLFVLLLVGVGIPRFLEDGLENALQFALFVAPAFVFVWAFTQTALRETHARIEVESLAARLREANEQLRGYADQIEELATARERNRLAREIHDSLGHYLTVVNVQIEAARAMLDRDRDKAVSALEKAQQLTRDGLADVRRSVSALRDSPLAGLSLEQALARLADEAKLAGVAVSLVVVGDVDCLDEKQHLALYRSAQEALTNVRKHAAAESVHVDLALEKDIVRLRVADDGVGCDQPGDGFGLRGLRERARLLGGTFRVESTKGQGFMVEIEFPRHSELNQ